MPPKKLTILPTALAVAALSACSFSAGEPTVTGDELAELAEDALEEETGSRPEMDCGSVDSISVSQDKEVDCVATSTETGAEYDATITFTSVEGRDYEISVEVASEPNNAPSEAPTSDPAEAETSAPAADANSIVVPAPDFAAAVADAVAAEWGEGNDIDCGDAATRTLYEGAIHSCVLIDVSTDAQYTITITITGIDVEAGSFNFEAEVDDTPLAG
ncbi:DUF4333 domain-containing protein [Glycomyces tritici]|uniref:DUF4333 domain-containing protein n=1 Tax=Glycomyces tritici TaxID=2665176 RepID=A0ABT7YHJ0_9ACTN|nr:DUF4333 domain-containing protein [Glycomyces tritici]MDN3238102.1 DUF4333 domain-containing protein [Glycomyces tritici]